MTIALGLVLALSFTACQKEKAGVYTPKKKIQEISYSWNSTEKNPYQRWVWDGDRVSSITHYTDFELKRSSWEEIFTYEDNRIKRVDNPSDQEYITYEYSDDHLRSATVFYRNAIVCTWSVGYEGKHVTRLTGTFYDGKKGGHEMHLNPLSHLFPPDLCAHLAQCERQAAQCRYDDDNYIIALQLNWKNDNISEMVISIDDELFALHLQYDDKHSPWYGFMGSLEDHLTTFEAGSTCFTKHNVTSMVYVEMEDDYRDTARYAYQYDSDNYPILQTRYTSDNLDEKRVLYFEY